MNHMNLDTPIITPAPGTTWLSDAAINTEEWLDRVFDNGIDLFDLSEYDEDDDVEWDHSQDLQDIIENTYGYIHVSRDNVYNHENDFSQLFTYSIYVPADNEDDWMYGPAIVAVCLHYGGDARGNYGAPRLYRTEALADSEFFDWMLGWHVTDEEGERIDDSDDYCAGHSANPTCALEDDLDLDNDTEEWADDGGFHTTMNGRKVICYPELMLN